MKRKVRKKVGTRKQMQKRAVENLAKGMTAEPALVAAGYSESYAHSKGYKVIRKPYIQSLLTEACERIMQKRNMALDAVIEPYFDALQAPLIVKSTQLGDAQIPTDTATGLPFPDHPTRMNAADRITKLFGADLKAEEEEGDKGPTRVFIRKWVTQEVKHVHVHSNGSNGTGAHGMRDDGAIPPALGAGASGGAMASDASGGGGTDRLIEGPGTSIRRTEHGDVREHAEAESVRSASDEPKQGHVSGRVVRRKILPAVPKRNDL